MKKSLAIATVALGILAVGAPAASAATELPARSTAADGWVAWSKPVATRWVAWEAPVSSDGWVAWQAPVSSDGWVAWEAPVRADRWVAWEAPSN